MGFQLIIRNPLPVKQPCPALRRYKAASARRGSGARLQQRQLSGNGGSDEPPTTDRRQPRGRGDTGGETDEAGDTTTHSKSKGSPRARATPTEATRVRRRRNDTSGARRRRERHPTPARSSDRLHHRHRPTNERRPTDTERRSRKDAGATWEVGAEKSINATSTTHHHRRRRRHGTNGGHQRGARNTDKGTGTGKANTREL